MDAAQLAYDAGIFDGEGWISPLRKRGVQVNVQVGLGNTDYATVISLHGRHGGSVHKLKPAENVRRKEYWTWIVTGNRAILFLETVGPYLQIKRARAISAIAFWTNKQGLSRSALFRRGMA